MIPAIRIRLCCLLIRTSETKRLCQVPVMNLRIKTSSTAVWLVRSPYSGKLAGIKLLILNYWYLLHNIPYIQYRSKTRTPASSRQIFNVTYKYYEYSTPFAGQFGRDGWLRHMLGVCRAWHWPETDPTDICPVILLWKSLGDPRLRLHSVRFVPRPPPASAEPSSCSTLNWFKNSGVELNRKRKGNIFLFIFHVLRFPCTFHVSMHVRWRVVYVGPVTTRVTLNQRVRTNNF
jgi:hypothetical protein